MVGKWFGGGKPDHPMAEEKGAREVLASLSKSDAAQAIADIRHWLESVVATEGFKAGRRAELFLLLDETAQAHQRKLARDYLSNPRPSNFQKARLRQALSGLWTDLAAAYAAFLEQIAADSASAARVKAQLPLLCVRAVRALAAQLKWQYMHYAPGAANVWETLGRVYRYAEAKKIHRETVLLYPGVPLSSSAEREFMQVLMLAASSPDCLMPLDIELAERIVAHFSASFLISDVHQPQVTYQWIDLASGLPSKRLTQTPPASPSLRFFAPGAANEQIDSLIRVLEKGAVPADLNLGGSYEAAKVLGVLRHLKMYWAATPPVRKNDRYEVKHRLTVVNGLEGILASLFGAAAQAGAESWETENISSGGVSAVVRNAQGDWLGIGKLVGLRMEGGSGAWSAGVVRRCSRLPQQQVSVGIQTFAKAAYAVTLHGGVEQVALLLSDGPALNEEVLICMRDGVFDKRVSPSMGFNGRKYLLIPVEVSEAGDEFEIARYRLMQPS
jgi:hypothetical protein